LSSLPEGSYVVRVLDPISSIASSSRLELTGDAAAQSQPEAIAGLSDPEALAGMGAGERAGVLNFAVPP